MGCELCVENLEANVKMWRCENEKDESLKLLNMV
jgi:hypothetical protein